MSRNPLLEDIYENSFSYSCNHRSGVRSFLFWRQNVSETDLSYTKSRNDLRWSKMFEVGGQS